MVLNLTENEKKIRLRKQKMNWYYRNKSFKNRYKSVIKELINYNFIKKYGVERSYILKQMKKTRIKKISVDNMLMKYETMMSV